MLSRETSMFFNIAKFEHAQRLANMLYQAQMWPKHLKTIGDALIILNLSSRLNADPVMLAQTVYIVGGRPGMEGKLVKSLVDQSGKYPEPIQYEWLDGKNNVIEDYTVYDNPDKDSRCGCRAFTKDAKTGKRIAGPKISWKLVFDEGWWSKDRSKWKTMAELMFMYRAASWFANVHCPEVKLGMHTKEELQDFVELTPGANGAYTTSSEAAKDITEAIYKNVQEGTEQPEPQGPVDPAPEKTPESTSEPIPCPYSYCKFKAASETGLKRHVTMSHDGIWPTESGKLDEETLQAEAKEHAEKKAAELDEKVNGTKPDMTTMIEQIRVFNMPIRVEAYSRCNIPMAAALSGGSYTHEEVAELLDMCSVVKREFDESDTYKH